jgi:hypothetical protein
MNARPLTTGGLIAEPATRDGVARFNRSCVSHTSVLAGGLPLFWFFLVRKQNGEGFVRPEGLFCGQAGLRGLVSSAGLSTEKGP